MLERLKAQPADPILSLAQLAREDRRADKLDLCVGVYIDEGGNTPVMAAVKSAERELLDTQVSKAYLGQQGDAGFVELLRTLAFGAELSARLGQRVQGMQTAGGVGALRIGAELLARAQTPAIVMGRPTWPIHEPIAGAAGLKVQWAPYFDVASQDLTFDALSETLRRAEPGSSVLIHASCHNPTGADLSPGQWSALAQIVAERSLVPFIDAAYLGLGDGLDADAAGLRTILNAVPAALVAVSCSKSFGVYRERVGALFIVGQSAKDAQIAMSNATAIARTLYSVPPDHGAAIVRLVLERDELRSSWRTELAAMRERLHAVRGDFAARAVAAGLPLQSVGRQRGMFSLLPLTQAQVQWLRSERAIYMPDSGRINLAALSLERSQSVVDALGDVQRAR